MSGVYWGVTSMFLMNKQEMMEKDEIIEFVKSCQHENGGFSASHSHDPHLLYTLSAVQVCESLLVATAMNTEGLSIVNILLM